MQKVKSLNKGRVIKSTGSWYVVEMQDATQVKCRIKGKLRTMGFKSTNPVAVGDIVDVQMVEQDGTGLIIDLQDRKNYIIRRSSNLSKTSHIIAANIDHAYLIVTIDYPVTYPEFIDRFLVTAEAYEIPASIIFNKADLYNASQMSQLKEWKTIYEKIGYSCIETSALKKKNIDLLINCMKGKVNLVSGNSGVGKSTLINCMDENLDLRVDEISSYHQKGKHTTAFAEMFPLSFGGYIIDTPGIKGFGIVDIPKKELYHHFPELFKVSEKCQYYNCTHIHEPGCAVLDALENNHISLSRYKSYVSLFYGKDEKYRQ